MKTGIITTNTYSGHDTGTGHPERADRVTVIIDHLKKLKSKQLIWKKPKKFDLKYLQLAHDKDYLNNVKDSFPTQGFNFLDGDVTIKLLILTCLSSIIFFKFDLDKIGISFTRTISKRVSASLSVIKNLVELEDI